MQQVNRYNVGGHSFVLGFAIGDPLLEQMQQYAPFIQESESADETLLFSLDVEEGVPADLSSIKEEMRQEEDGAIIRVGRWDGCRVFEFGFFGQVCALLVCTDENFTLGKLYTMNDRLSGLNSALMVMYALSSVRKHTLLLHASVVVHQGLGYLFLGHSGTGKSTHSRLWLKHIAGSRLLNDDNPVVRVCGDGVVRVYGSPWSGKTPCYVDADFPIGAIVRLSQAPYNRIRRLSPLEAYAALRPAVSGMRWNREVAEGLHRTETDVVSCVSTWRLECLPDAEAAQCCADAVAPTVECLAESRVINQPSAVLEEVHRLIASGHRVVLPVKGYSMLPFIVGGKESVVLVAPSAALHVGDIVLAYVNGCTHVIHRIVEMDGENLKLMGDGNLALREHCRCTDVVAQAVAVISEKGKEKSLTKRLWLWRVWYTLLPIRRYLLAVIKIR